MHAHVSVFGCTLCVHVLHMCVCVSVCACVRVCVCLSVFAFQLHCVVLHAGVRTCGRLPCCCSLIDLLVRVHLSCAVDWFDVGAVS